MVKGSEASPGAPAIAAPAVAAVAGGGPLGAAQAYWVPVVVGGARPGLGAPAGAISVPDLALEAITSSSPLAI